MSGEVWWALAGDPDRPAFETVVDPGPETLRLCRHRRAEMRRLVRVGDGALHLATAADRAIAGALFKAIDRAATVAIDEPPGGSGRGKCFAAAEQLVGWLARFRDAAETIERRARLGP